MGTALFLTLFILCVLAYCLLLAKWAKWMSDIIQGMIENLDPRTDEALADYHPSFGHMMPWHFFRMFRKWR